MSIFLPNIYIAFLCVCWLSSVTGCLAGDYLVKEMGRKPCCDKIGVKKGPWSIEEDRKLINFIVNHGIHCWRTVPKLAGFFSILLCFFLAAM